MVLTLFLLPLPTHAEPSPSYNPAALPVSLTLGVWKHREPGGLPSRGSHRVGYD